LGRFSSYRVMHLLQSAVQSSHDRYEEGFGRTGESPVPVCGSTIVNVRTPAEALPGSRQKLLRISTSSRVTPAMEAGLTDHVWTLLPPQPQGSLGALNAVPKTLSRARLPIQNGEKGRSALSLSGLPKQNLAASRALAHAHGFARMGRSRWKPFPLC
jgi:hypothetical protein